MYRVWQSLLFLLYGSLLWGTDEGNLLTLPPGELNEKLREVCMPELADTRVGKILNRYYKDVLGGPDNWEKLLSLYVVGTLKTGAGELTLNAYQKKPDSMKMVLSKEDASQDTVILAYDGTSAWRQRGRQQKPELMTREEARRFVHGARFGNYLLYPYAENKRIRLVDTVPVEGTICHQIRVELDNDYQVDYFLDIRSYLEIKVVNLDLRTGLTNSVIYKDYTFDHAIPIARRVETFEAGEWISGLSVVDIKFNSGIMPWMFTFTE